MELNFVIPYIYPAMPKNFYQQWSNYTYPKGEQQGQKTNAQDHSHGYSSDG